MRKINNYVARSVTGAVFMVLLVVMALLIIAAFVDEIGSLRGNYTWLEMLIYVSLTMPRRIYEIMPFACLIGCLVGLGVLANSSELVVMRAAGISVKRITWMVVKPLCWFILAGVLIGEFVTPYTDQVSESRRAMALDKPSPQSKRGNLWVREGHDYIQFNAVSPNGVVYGITRYSFDDERNLRESSFSRQATYREGSWNEENIAVTHFETFGSLDEAALGKSAERYMGTRSENLESRRWQTSMTPETLHLLVAEPQSLSMRSLYQYIDYLQAQNLVATDYWLAFWKKLLQPLATASLVLIAISFIFGPLREVTMGQRIFSGVVFGVVFQLTQDLLGPSSIVFGFAPIIAVLLPIAVCAAIGVYLLSRTR